MSSLLLNGLVSLHYAGTGALEQSGQGRTISPAGSLQQRGSSLRRCFQPLSSAEKSSLLGQPLLRVQAGVRGHGGSSLKALRGSGVAVAAVADPATQATRSPPIDAPVGAKLLSGLLGLVGREERPVADPLLTGNYTPVKEMRTPVPVKVVEGAIPADFPKGVFARNGPNPYFPPTTLVTPFGRYEHHLFEGDGMIHATTFDGKGGATYHNAFVETDSLLKEKAHGGRLFLNTIVTPGGPAGLLTMAVNKLALGAVTRMAANTHVIHHHGRCYALNEGDKPWEITLPDLKTVGRQDFGGKLDFNFSAHAKVCPVSGELLFFAYNVSAPQVTLGVISKDGRLIHKEGLDVGRASLSHDFAITPRFNLFLVHSLTIDPQRAMSGGFVVDWEEDKPYRLAVMPRYGDSSSLKYFDLQPGFSFHVCNAYEDGEDEVVMVLAQQRKGILRQEDGVSWEETAEERYGIPHGIGLPYMREIRANLKTGAVSERQLSSWNEPMEFPRVNNAYTGLKFKYAYACKMDVAECLSKGIPSMSGVIKYSFEGDDGQTSGDKPLKRESHTYGGRRFGGEPVFVPRPGGQAEDDGWVVVYVHEEGAPTSQVHILDAQNISEAPVAILDLGYRVPWGFHGNFIPL